MSSQPLHVALTTPLLSMPPTYFVTEHAEELMREGSGHRFRVHPLAARIAPGSSTLPISPALRIPSSYDARKRLAPIALPLQAAAVRHSRPDVIHQHHGVWTAGASAAAASLGVPMVTTVHGTDMFTAALPSPRGLQRVHRANARLAFKRSALVLAVSDDLRRVALSAGAPVDRTHVHYQGIDTDTFTPGDLGRTGMPRPRILFVGSLIPLKRVDLVIRASQQLARSVEHELHIVGDGPLRADLEALTEGSAHVRFHGALDRAGVLQSMRDADVLALPSVRESAGLVLLEAQACGVPVVVTGGDGKSEMLRDGETGTVLARDPETTELANALRDWLPDSDSIRREIAAQTRAFVVSERSVKTGAKRLAEFYALVAG